MRYKQIRVVEKEGGSGTETITTVYIGKHFEVEQRDSFTNYRHFISDVAIVDLYDNKPSQIAFTYRDRLGSTVTMTDHNDNTTSLRHFDPFGKPRGGDWSLLDDDISIATNRLQDNLQDQRSDIRRGFTDHEHLDEAELIHMNGRVYEYNVGRFMSVDPLVHTEAGSQGINPYSYIYNNPLSGTDPTGYKASEEEKETVKIEATVTPKTERIAVTGSRIREKRTTKSVSGTVTSSNGVTTSVEGTISNGKFEGTFTTSVGESSVSSDIAVEIGSSSTTNGNSDSLSGSGGSSEQRKADGTYFFGGAGLDPGRTYSVDMAAAFEEAGISDVHLADPALWSGGLILDAVVGVLSLNEEVDNEELLALMREKFEGQGDGQGQLNLIGYSYGSLVAAHVALTHVQYGGVVDNLVLIGSPITKDFLDSLRSNPGIRNIIVKDLVEHGDPIYAGMSGFETVIYSPVLATQMIQGGGHFYYAPMSDEGKARRRELGKELYNEGLR